MGIVDGLSVVNGYPRLARNALQVVTNGYPRVPSTLQDSLIARLNNMAIAKAVAQIGAVIGGEFKFRLIQTIAGMEAESNRIDGFGYVDWA